MENRAAAPKSAMGKACVCLKELWLWLWLTDMNSEADSGFNLSVGFFYIRLDLSLVVKYRVIDQYMVVRARRA